ncbi:MAG: tetratricopeptide repeat protein [Thermoguttaceae bacterium]|jgi:tetratricopeptide (TPR) repeat protein
MPNRKKSSIKQDTQTRSGISVPSPLLLSELAGVAIIILAAFIAYFPSLNGGFIWDDEMLITNNHLIKASDGLYRFWCTSEPFDYWPVTNTTFWIEWRLWGMNPTGYRVTNLILHIVEALLIWLILRKLSIPGAFLAAAIFAVHPVNVESVAWIAQRKNTMAMLFFLLSIPCYLKMEVSSPPGTTSVVARPSPLFYWLSLLAFVLAMLSKGSVAVLPVLLLGIVWWQRTGSSVSKWDLVRTAPFFMVSVVLTPVHIWFQMHGSEEAIRTAGFAERILGAGGVVWFYLYKALLPFNLSFVYPQWEIQSGNPLWWLPLLAVLAVTAVLWRYREGWSRPFLFAWGFFCMALAPVMGLTDVYFMKYSLVADHYQHIAVIAVIALAAAGWSCWHKRVRAPNRWTTSTVALIVAGTLVALTWRQSGLYRDEITLYRDTLKKNPECWLANNNLGKILAEKGQLKEAIELYHKAMRLRPDYPQAHNNLGIVLAQIGQPEKAIEHFNQALRFDPKFAEAHSNIGNTLRVMGQYQEAIVHFQQALRFDPKLAEAHSGMGNTLRVMGQYQEAIEHYEQCMRLRPDYPQAYNNLGIVLAQIGQPEKAIEQYKKALQIKPDYINACYNLALTYADVGNSSEAIAAARKALDLARAKGQKKPAKQIENWLNSYRAAPPNSQNMPPSPKSNPPTP